jgi:DNA modification methylase
VSIQYRIGDVFDRLADIPDDSIDLIVTSPPFLALRSYLPDDHEHKHLEIGSEATPAEFIDTMLALSAEWGRVLAPHGSLCVELGDTYSGNNTTGWHRSGEEAPDRYRDPGAIGSTTIQRDPVGWPLAKSMTGIPTLYTWSLAYGRNLLTGQPSPAGQWRIRNLICWARPNPPVGALGDKFRPATSYITVACQSPRRYFDLDAVRTEHLTADALTRPRAVYRRSHTDDGVSTNTGGNPAGTPPLDWHADDHPEDGDWLWKLSTQPYKGSHYAAFPMALPKRLIEAMCPLRVCIECGKPSERIVENHPFNLLGGEHGGRHQGNGGGSSLTGSTRFATEHTTLGWTDCGHDNWRTGITLDPFAGTGTTLEAAQAVGRHAIGIDLDPRNADLARDRVGMFLEIQP